MNFDEANELMSGCRDRAFMAFRIIEQNSTLCTGCFYYKKCNMRRYLEMEHQNIQGCYYYTEVM